MNKISTQLLSIAIFIFASFSISAQTINVNIYMDLRGSAYESVTPLYATGTAPLSWSFNQCTEVQSKVWKLAFSYTKGAAAGDSMSYYFLTAASWTETVGIREDVVSPCNEYWGRHRKFYFKSTKDTSVGYKWGKCEAYKPSDLLTGISLPDKMDVNVYAIPSLGILKLSTPVILKNVSVVITDISGKTVKISRYKQVNTEQIINISGLSKGVYLVKMLSTQKSLSKKIVLN